MNVNFGFDTIIFDSLSAVPTVCKREINEPFQRDSSAAPNNNITKYNNKAFCRVHKSMTKENNLIIICFHNLRYSLARSGETSILYVTWFVVDMQIWNPENPPRMIKDYIDILLNTSCSAIRLPIASIHDISEAMDEPVRRCSVCSL